VEQQEAQAGPVGVVEEPGLARVARLEQDRPALVFQAAQELDPYTQLGRVEVLRMREQTAAQEALVHNLIHKLEAVALAILGALDTTLQVVIRTNYIQQSMAVTEQAVYSL
jgi:hypothetical protein